jgi:arginase family enzyme
VHGGLSEKEAVNLLKAFWSEPNVFAIEVTEINPLLDRHNPMEDVAANIIAASIS